MVSKPEKRLTETQLERRVAKLDTDSQHLFFQYADPLLNEESEIFLSVIAKCRTSFADAITKLREEDQSDDDDEPEMREELMESTPFDTSTQLGQNMAKISQAFNELLAVERPKSALTEEGSTRLGSAGKKKERKKTDEDKTDREQSEGETSSSSRPHSSKKKKKRKRHKEAILADSDKAAQQRSMAEQLEVAAQEEREAILEKMKSHGNKIDGERKRQKDRLSEKLDEARKMKGRGSRGVDVLLDKKNDLDEIQQKDRERQETVIQDRLKKRKSRKHIDDAQDAPPDIGDEEADIGTGEGQSLPTYSETNETESGKRKKSRKKAKENTDMEEV